jgi:membrane protease YdiL (CAAX protease family)
LDPTLPEPAPPGPPATPGADPSRKSALAFFAVLLLLLLPDLLAQGASPTLGLAWSELFTLLLPAVMAAAGANLRPAAYLGFARPRPLPLLLGLLLGVAGFVASSGVMSLWVNFLPRRVLELFPDVARIFVAPPLARAAVTLTAVLLAPVCEEAVFRGYLQRTLALRRTPAAAVALAAVLFALRHLDPVRFPALALLGGLFGWIAWRTGSIWPAIAAHVANNAAAAAVALLAPPAGPVAPMPTPAEAVAPLVLGGTALVLLGAWLQGVTSSPPPPEAALQLRDPGDPSVRFRLGRLPPRLVELAGLGLLLLWVLVAASALQRAG